MLNPLDLTDKNILVTGASSGVGRETAILLSQLGARVILVARREEELLKTKDLMCDNNHIVVPFDLINIDQISTWMKKVAAEVGGLHGLVHSAGIQIIRPVRFITQEDVTNTFSVSINAAFMLSKAFRQRDVFCKNSSMIFLASVAGIVGGSGLTIYTASKGAIISFVKSLALEFARDEIRVNCVAPGMVQTEMLANWGASLTDEQRNKNLEDSPLGVGAPRDVANSIAFLLSDAARWITGTTLVVDGGYTAK